MGGVFCGGGIKTCSQSPRGGVGGLIRPGVNKNNSHLPWAQNYPQVTNRLSTAYPQISSKNKDHKKNNDLGFLIMKVIRNFYQRASLCFNKVNKNKHKKANTKLIINNDNTALLENFRGLGNHNRGNVTKYDNLSARDICIMQNV